MTDLHEVYDAATLAAIDARSGEPEARPSGGWRGRAAGGALVMGMLQGAKDALEDEEVEPVVDLEAARRTSRLEPVSVHLVPGCPAASVAIVRRWLFTDSR